ncbi:hypothetical protein CH06BL_13340 [Chromobacterium haemolyticum]|nr:hypothetical protein CH06BL_13340 [Chromobacterium haemolyticum]
MNCASQRRKTQPALSFAINNNHQTAKALPGRSAARSDMNIHCFVQASTKDQAVSRCRKTPNVVSSPRSPNSMPLRRCGQPSKNPRLPWLRGRISQAVSINIFQCHSSYHMTFVMSNNIKNQK